MRLFGNFLLRFIMICVGFVFAVIAAGTFVAIGLYSEIATTEIPMEAWETEFLQLISIGYGLVITVLIGAYSFGVIALIIVLAEAFRWDGLVSNLVMGGICAAFLMFTRSAGLEIEGEPIRQISDGVWLVTLSAGFVGGFTYWLVAGHRAGQWLGQ